MSLINPLAVVVTPISFVRSPYLVVNNEKERKFLGFD